MKKNMGKIDRLLRVILAIIFIVLFFTKTITGVGGIILMMVAGIFLLTSLIRFCPLYYPFGIKTNKSE